MVSPLGIDGSFSGRAVKEVQKLDVWLIASALILLVGGLIAVHSVDAGSHKVAYLPKQLLWALIGLAPFGVCARVAPEFWQRAHRWLYGINILCLVLVLVMGQAGGGAQRWLSVGPLQFQPSEMSKLLIVVTLSNFYASRLADVRRISTFVLSFLHILPSVVLVYMQPHLGATLTILVIWFVISIYAGVPWSYLITTMLAGVALLGIAFTVPGLMHGYQKGRALAMFGGDSKSSNYQQTRAKIAFGVGGLMGSGYMKGEEKAAGYIPEQQTDFIFTVMGEEGGFVGCALTLAAYGFFFYRVWVVGFRASNPFGRLVAGGILGFLAFHTIVNLGMNLGVSPVVGLWLPFMSYGGTALWLCMASVGLLANLRRAETQQWFA